MWISIDPILGKMLTHKIYSELIKINNTIINRLQVAKECVKRCLAFFWKKSNLIHIELSPHSCYNDYYLSNRNKTRLGEDVDKYLYTVVGKIN